MSINKRNVNLPNINYILTVALSRRRTSVENDDC